VVLSSDFFVSEVVLDAIIKFARRRYEYRGKKPTELRCLGNFCASGEVLSIGNYLLIAQFICSCEAFQFFFCCLATDASAKRS
jgi:hypothetical protein